MTSLQIQIPIYQGEWEECLLSPPQETQSFPSQTRSSSASGLNPGEGAIGFLETVQKKRSPVAGGSEPSTSNALLGIWWFISLEPLYCLESWLSCQFLSLPQITPHPALCSCDPLLWVWVLSRWCRPCPDHHKSWPLFWSSWQVQPDPGFTLFWYLVQTCISSSLAPHSVIRLKPWPKIRAFPCWKLPCILSALFGQVCAQISYTRDCLLFKFLLASSTVCIPTCLLLFANSCCPVH